MTVKAVSTFNSEITATKSINVTYKETVDELTSISIVGNDTVEASTYQFEIAYNPVNTSKKGVTWSVTSGNAYASIDSSTGKLTVLSGAKNSSVTIKAVSNFDAEITASKNLIVTGTNLIYALDEPFIGDGERKYLDTGIQLYDSSMDSFSILLKCKPLTIPFITTGSSNDPKTFISCLHDSSP